MGRGVAKCSQCIRDFTEKYNLTVNEKYQDTLNEFLNTAGVADENDKLKKQVDEIIDNIVIERVTNEWGQYTAYVSMYPIALSLKPKIKVTYSFI